MIRPFAILVALAAPAAAETARVISGEHGDFTRLVIELPDANAWTVGRTALGYGFAVLGPDQPGYDLSTVWDRISRDRLQALRTDPETGALQMTLACDCSVFPFEYQPGTIVLDIRDGAAPVGSVFETPFSPQAAPSQRDFPFPAKVALTYDWLDLDRAPPAAAAPDRLSFPLDQPIALLDPLREELLRQLSRGAADGVVEMVLPAKPAGPEVESMGDLSGALIRIGQLPGLEVGQDASSEAAKAAGEGCLQEDALDLASWGDGRPALDLLAEARAGLYGEFDRLSPEALRRAIEVHLYLGFGAEALQYGRLLPGSDTDPGLAPLLAIARLIDGESDPGSLFAPMLGCDGPAALWAALAYTGLPKDAEVNTDAIVRGFQALPAHLRRYLGPGLSNLLLDRDPEAARMVRDAVERTPDVPAGTVALIDAEADLKAARPEDALGHAEAAVEDVGTGLPGLLALVEAHFQSGQPLSPEVAASLLAYRDAGTENKAGRDRATVLALALSGQVEAAFKIADPADPVIADLWRVVAKLAEDSPFLTQAVLRPSDPAPPVEPDVALAVAVRLLDLGFPEASKVWLRPVDAASSVETRLTSAKIELALGDARKALELLSGLDGPDVPVLRAEAYRQLGAYDAAMQALDSAGKPEDSTRLAAWDANWAYVQDRGTPSWATAATLAQPSPTDAAGPLAEGRAALDDSAAARQAINALLADVPTPQDR